MHDIFSQTVWAWSLARIDMDIWYIYLEMKLNSRLLMYCLYLYKGLVLNLKQILVVKDGTKWIFLDLMNNVLYKSVKTLSIWNVWLCVYAQCDLSKFPIALCLSGSKKPIVNFHNHLGFNHIVNRVSKIFLFHTLSTEPNEMRCVSFFGGLCSIICIVYFSSP